jgi:hypothetical protein
MHLRREHYVGLGDAVGLFAAFEGTTSLLNGRCNGNLNHEKSPGTDAKASQVVPNGAARMDHLREIDDSPRTAEGP